MAEADDMTNCPVCFEVYAETGSHIPRLLPCTHTVCELCIQQLIRGKQALNCPECRVRHPVHNRVKTFAQNKYILTHLKRQITQQKENTTKEKESTKQDTKRSVKCKVLKSIATNHDHITGVALLADSSVVVCASERFTWKLVKYSLQSGKEISHAALQEPPQGMTEIKLAGKQCLALSYGDKRTILFHDAKILDQVVQSCLVSPHWPARMCASFPSTLLFVDVTKDPCEVHYLDCSVVPPKQETRHTQTQQHFLRDMCHVQYADKTFLVTTHFSSTFDKRIDSGIRAYDTNTQNMEWCITGSVGPSGKEINPCGVVTDGRGHLFICDPVNGCVQMFSADGQHLDVLLREGDQGLGKPRWLRWLEGISSLIVTHEKEKRCFIDVIHIGQLSNKSVSVQFVPSHFSTV